MNSTQWRSAVVNSFGTLGYISIIIQWTWCAVTLGHPLLSADRPLLLPQAPIPEVGHPIELGAFTPLVSIIAILVTILMVVVTIFTLLRLPRSIGKKGANVTHVVASTIIKQKYRHHTLPAKKRIQLSLVIILLLKAVAIYVPVALVFITPPVDGLTTQLITTVGVACALFSTVYFTIQLVLALALKIDKNKIW